MNTLLMDNQLREIEDVKFWDRLAPKYAKDQIADLAGYENTIKQVSALLKDSDNVLELGCGTASTAIRLAPFCNRYLATDISPGMIAQGQAKLDTDPIVNLTLQAASAASLRHQATQYDAILGFNYLHLVGSLPETLFNIHSMLKPGGKFISKTPCMKDLSTVLKIALPLALPIMRMLGKAPQIVTSFNKTELEKDIKTAGFEIEAIEWHGTKGNDPRPFIVARKA